MLCDAAGQNIIAFNHHTHLALAILKIALHPHAKRKRTDIRHKNIPYFLLPLLDCGIESNSLRNQKIRIASHTDFPPEKTA